jgi:hypothetical protein
LIFAEWQLIASVVIVLFLILIPTQKKKRRRHTKMKAVTAPEVHHSVGLFNLVECNGSRYGRQIKKVR